MPLKHIRKELFLPLLYYIYSDECEVGVHVSITDDDGFRLGVDFHRLR